MYFPFSAQVAWDHPPVDDKPVYCLAVFFPNLSIPPPPDCDLFVELMFDFP